MPARERPAEFGLTLSAGERAELLRLLEQELRETHVEARRTESPNFQDKVHDRESMLQKLLHKFCQG
jgi:hypothetical protein